MSQNDNNSGSLAGSAPNVPAPGAANNNINTGNIPLNNPNPPVGDANNAAGGAPAENSQAAGGQGAAQPPAQNKPEEEKKDQVSSALVANPLADKHPQLSRSFLLPNNDRYILEQEHMQSLVAGSGIFGTTLIDLEALKREKCDIPEGKSLHKNKEMLENLRLDGIYVDDPEVASKFTDINVQKLEERLLKNGQKEFFKMNGELKLDNDILDDDLTRPADLAFEQTAAFHTKEINAILSDRLHSFKKMYYRIDIILGNLKMFNCKNYLGEEDKKAIKLKEKFQDYETRISLAMIPFYMERVSFIEQEISMKQNSDGTPESELKFLIKTKETVERSLEKEKLEVNNMANELYQVWSEIEAARKNQGFNSTNVELRVHQQTEENGEIDQILDLKYDNNITQFKDLPSAEKSRQNRIKKLQVYAVLLINERKVSKTNKSPVSWPSFSFQIKEMFQVHVFTVPSSIKVELILVDGFSETTMDIINVEVPGAHVKSLTCSAALIQKIPFSHVAFEKRKIAKKYSDLSYKPDGELSEKQRAQKIQESEKKEKQELMKKENDILGEIFIKAEWKGSGPKMPPIRSENLFKKEKLHKNRYKYTQEQEYMMLLRQLYIDVNDPRNQSIIKVLRETKNEFLVNLLRADSKNLMADAKPFRHKLLHARQKDSAGFGKIFIPMLESEVIDSLRSSFYLEQLEQLFRNEAYLIHVRKMVEKQKEVKDEGKEEELNNLFNLMDLDTLTRRQEIFDLIKKRQQQHQNESSKSGSTYRGVVNEEEFNYDTNFLSVIATKLFMKGRKLRPLVKEQPAKNLEQFKECKIVVHCIKGENVPIRHSIVSEYNQYLQADKDGNRNMNKALRPTPNLPQNLTGDPNYDRQESLEDDRQNRVTKTKEQLDNMPQVQTYVEIKIQYHEKYTMLKTTNTDEGAMPRWNEILDFPLTSENNDGFTQEELQKSKTVIICSLFDKQSYTSEREGERVTLEEHRFLGSVQIPLVTLLSNPGKTDFNFRLDRPAVLPNYRVLNEEIYFMSAAELEKNIQMRNEQPATYVNLSINIEPNIELPYENSELSYPGYESQKMLDDGAKWTHDRMSTTKFKHPNIAVFGENIRGESILLCRFLTEQKPPMQVVDLEQNPGDLYAIEKVARFVSLIPFVEDLRLFQDMPDLYCTSQEFFDLGGGDYEEHAILLANYFTYIDNKQGRSYQSYLVLGAGMPNGHMVYVMRKDKDEIAKGSFELWDPTTGYCYYFNCESSDKRILGIKCGESRVLQQRITDPICPLTQVHCVISNSNIYVNVQKQDYPILMDFNINYSKSWKKFLPEDKVQDSIQPEIRYSDPREHTEVIESRIQKYLVEMFQEERIKKVRKTTKWAVTINDELKRILIDCEDWSRMARKGGIKSELLGARKDQNENMDLQQITQQLDTLAQQDQNRRVWGFPLNTTFTSLENLWKMVQTTKMHALKRQDVEFGLSVYIQAYPGNILSVWVYLAAFVDVSIENLYQ